MNFTELISHWPLALTYYNPVTMTETCLYLVQAAIFVQMLQK